MNDLQGGLTLRFPGSVCPGIPSGTKRQLRRLATTARLMWSGSHMVISTHAALRRAQGVGIAQGAPASRKLRRSLVASGVSVQDAHSATWVSMW
jgi:hypothetical protein